jgi:cyclopropane fatty-acyl-phospholipid synthase-like methyltransferase
MSAQAQRHAPATARNREPILEVLRRVLPASGTVLEIASGSGEHAVFLARHLPGITWQPSDLDADARASIDAWRRGEALDNVATPLAIDARAAEWGIERADAVVCINMVHISPWEATEGLIRGAARLLPSGGVLYLYGPYRIDGRDTAPSNLAFDESLRARNPDWGVRHAAGVQRLAAAAGLELVEIVDMPANNFSLVFRK